MSRVAAVRKVRLHLTGSLIVLIHQGDIKETIAISEWECHNDVECGHLGKCLQLLTPGLQELTGWQHACTCRLVQGGGG